MDEDEDDLLEEPEAPPPLNRNLSFGLSGLLDAMRRSATSGSSLLTSTSAALPPTPPVRRKRRRRRRRSPPIVAGPPAVLAPKTSDSSSSGIKNDPFKGIEDVPLAPKNPQPPQQPQPLPPPPPQQPQPRPVPKKTLAQLQLSCSPKNKVAAAVTAGTSPPTVAAPKPATARDFRPMRNVRNKKKKVKQAPKKKKNKTKQTLRLQHDPTPERRRRRRRRGAGGTYVQGQPAFAQAAAVSPHRVTGKEPPADGRLAMDLCRLFAATVRAPRPADGKPAAAQQVAHLGQAETAARQRRHSSTRRRQHAVSRNNNDNDDNDDHGRSDSH